jgi:hypothetical protein
MVELSALSTAQKLVFESTTIITWTHSLHHIRSNATAQCKHQHRFSVFFEKGRHCRTVQKEGEKKKEDAVTSGYPEDLTFIPSLKCLITPSGISGSAEPGLMKAKTRGMARSRTEKTP